MKAIVCALVMALMIPSWAGAAIENVQVANNTDVSVTISWTTDGNVTGEVRYGQNTPLAKIAYDVRGRFYSGCTHYVEITGLTKETLYYFEVRAGGETDDNGGNYYTFRTMKQPQSPPLPCTISGCIYKDDGETLAVDAMVYLRVTHGGVVSYPLSDLLGSPGDATPGCFSFDIKQARSTVTSDLFPSIDPGDRIYIEAIDCNFRVLREMAFQACFSNIGFLTLGDTQPGTTTTSLTVTTTTSTTSSVPGDTTSIPVTTTSVPGGPCTTDAECDDGLFCNGAETCDPEAGCRPGSAPCTDDEIYCNGVESCDEEDDECVSSGNPCGENEVCVEEDKTCMPVTGIEASITGCGFPFFARLGIVEIQGNGTDFKPLSVVRYDSPLVIKGLKLVNRRAQTITQFVILMPGLFLPAWNYPATVEVTVDGFSGTLEIPACRR